MEINIPRGSGNSANLPPLKFGPWTIPVIAIFIAFVGAGTVFYQVGPDEVGVVQQLGKYVRTTQPGLHFKLPFSLETVRNVKVTYVYKEEFGFRSVSPGVRTVYDNRSGINPSMRRGSSPVYSPTGRGSDPYLEESLMLTGDLNVAVVEWIVQYTVKDPVAYAFRIRDPRETIRNMSEAVMRLVIGDHTINQILTAGREEIQAEAEKKLQEVLDSYGAGVAVRQVILQDVTPPNEVKPSFNEVNEARQEKEKVINQAWEEYNRIIPRSKGRASQAIREAEGYALERVNRSQGDADRFVLAWEAYRKAPEVTRRRLYIEAMERILPELHDKLVLDESAKGILPLLNLNPESEKGEPQS
ncbi:MAG: FtsH protease activity modulator HflK [Candidatus Omnitrophota bacterium]|jgi:membrane protease subunit HflK